MSIANFLLNETSNISTVKPAQVREILSMVPEKIPFYRLQTANGKTINEILRRTIFEKREEQINPAFNRGYDYSDFEYYESDWHDYEYLDEVFDEDIDEVEEAIEVNIAIKETDFSNLLQSANPSVMIHFSVCLAVAKASASFIATAA